MKDRKNNQKTPEVLSTRDLNSLGLLRGSSEGIMGTWTSLSISKPEKNQNNILDEDT